MPQNIQQYNTFVVDGESDRLESTTLALKVLFPGRIILPQRLISEVEHSIEDNIVSLCSQVETGILVVGNIDAIRSYSGDDNIRLSLFERILKIKPEAHCVLNTCLRYNEVARSIGELSIPSQSSVNYVHNSAKGNLQEEFGRVFFDNVMNYFRALPPKHPFHSNVQTTYQEAVAAHP